MSANPPNKPTNKTSKDGRESKGMKAIDFHTKQNNRTNSSKLMFVPNKTTEQHNTTGLWHRTPTTIKIYQTIQDRPRAKQNNASKTGVPNTRTMFDASPGAAGVAHACEIHGSKRRIWPMGIPGIV